ncbi:MAG: flagellar hook-basal body complex protein, partial [Clostridia bacterium]|nr:flagellar hook-basal body complex protein [Clostridia bacterium]
MMRALYSGVAGLKSHQTQMDVIGNNIANVNTYGFKSSRVTFRDVYYQTLSGASGSGTTLGGTNPSQIGYGAQISSVDVINSRSGMARTGLGSDCYISGEGYFVVEDGTNYLYTRVGAFNFDSDGYLVDGNGRKVCGAKGTNTVSTTAPEAIQIDAALNGKLNNITYGSDGVITGEDDKGTIHTIGTIGLANVPNPQGLNQEGNSYFKAVSNTGTVAYGAP